MTGDQIPDDDHVVRYLKPADVDGTTVNGAAFCLRSGEPGLSVNWLEILHGTDPLSQLDEVRRLFRLQLSRNGRFAKLDVGETKGRVLKGAKEAGISLALGICEVPLARTCKHEADPSHAEITGLPSSDSDEAVLVGDLIADCIIPPLYPARTDHASSH